MVWLLKLPLFQSLRGVLVGFRHCNLSEVHLNQIVSIPKRGFGGFSLGGSSLGVGLRELFQSLRGVLVGFRPGGMHHAASPNPGFNP